MPAGAARSGGPGDGGGCIGATSRKLGKGGNLYNKNVCGKRVEGKGQAQNLKQRDHRKGQVRLGVGGHEGSDIKKQASITRK